MELFPDDGARRPFIASEATPEWNALPFALARRSPGRLAKGAGLPWQGTTDAYRIWLSEVMLQQTQVATVCLLRALPRAFPDVAALAAAPLGRRAALWSGLGYYARARHLHRGGQAVVAGTAGIFRAARRSWRAARHRPLDRRRDRGVRLVSAGDPRRQRQARACAGARVRRRHRAGAPPRRPCGRSPPDTCPTPPPASRCMPRWPATRRA